MGFRLWRGTGGPWKSGTQVLPPETLGCPCLSWARVGSIRATSGWGSPGPGAGEGSAGSPRGPGCRAQTARGCPPRRAPGARVQCPHFSGKEAEVTHEVCPLTGLAGNPGLWVQGPGWPPRLRAQSPPGNAWVDPAGAHGQAQPQTGPCPDTALQTWNAGTPAQRGGRGTTALGSILLRRFDL